MSEELEATAGQNENKKQYNHANGEADDNRFVRLMDGRLVVGGGHPGGGGGLGEEGSERAGGRHFEDDKSCCRVSSGFLEY